MAEQMTNKNYSGFIKIWKTHKVTGISEVVVDKPNTILYQGSDLLAYALAGLKYAKISHIYVGFENYDDLGPPFSLPSVSKNYNLLPFSVYGLDGDNYNTGYFRLPLTYNPTYQASSTDYENNTVIFTTILTPDESPLSAREVGDPLLFLDSTASPIQSHLYEVALAAALDPTTPSKDLIFSRAVFNPIMFDSSYNLTISWGIQFLS